MKKTRAASVDLASMNLRRLSAIYIDIVVAVFIFIFLYTAFDKLGHHNQFRFLVRKSPLLKTWSEWLIWIIPGLEILVSVLLFFPLTKKMGMVASTSLMSAFSLYVAYMLYFSPTLPCSCGGIINKMSWNSHLLVNLFFTAAGCMALYFINHQKRLLIDRGSRKPAEKSRPISSI